MQTLRISVVYQSSGGHTRALAEAVVRGRAKVEAVSAELLEINGQDVVNGRWRNDEIFAKLDVSDAIVFGCAIVYGEIGLEPMDDDVHRVFFCNTELGEFNSSEMRFRPALRT